MYQVIIHTSVINVSVQLGQTGNYTNDSITSNKHTHACMHARTDVMVGLGQTLAGLSQELGQNFSVVHFVLPHHPHLYFFSIVKHSPQLPAMAEHLYITTETHSNLVTYAANVKGSLQLVVLHTATFCSLEANRSTDLWT